MSASAQQRHDYTHAQLISAVVSVLVPSEGRSQRLSEKHAQATYGVPRTTIQRHVNQLRDETSDLSSLSAEEIESLVQDHVSEQQTARHDGHSLLSAAEEAELHLWVLDMDRVCHAIPPQVIKDKAEEMLTARRAPKCSVGKHYIGRLLKKWPDVSARVASSLVATKYRSATRESVDEWFKLAGPIIRKYRQEQVWAGDETGLKGDIVTGTHVIGRRGKANIFTAGGSDSMHTSVLQIGNAKGSSIPPIIIFQSPDRVHPSMHAGEIPGTMIGSSESGFFNQQHFLNVIHHFINNTPSTKHLLIFDGAEAHMSVATINLCLENNLELLILPSHHSHILQVSDVGVFSAFKSKWRMICDTFHREHANQIINKYNIMPLIAETWRDSVTAKNIIAGFRATGTWPFNPSKIKDDLLVRTKRARPPPQLSTTVTTSVTAPAVNSASARAKRKRDRDERQMLDDVTKRLRSAVMAASAITTHGVHGTNADIEQWRTSVANIASVVAGEDVLVNGYDAGAVPAEAVSEVLALPEPPAPVQRQRNSLVPLDRGALITSTDNARRFAEAETIRAARRAGRGRGRGRGGRGRGRGGRGGGRGGAHVADNSDQGSERNSSCIVC